MSEHDLRIEISNKKLNYLCRKLLTFYERNYFGRRIGHPFISVDRIGVEATIARI